MSWKEIKKWVAALGASGIIRWHTLKFIWTYSLKPTIVKVISTVTKVIAAVIKGILKKAVASLMKTIMSAFKLITSPLASNPYTLALAIAMKLLIGALAAYAFANFKFATGGFPAYNQPFIAREAGPELVGTLNGCNAVINNDQIVEAVSAGVFQAFVAAWENNSSNESAIASVYLDGKLIATAGQTA